ncbi:hypothetical protein BSL78_27513 [Apostichopus japonicus]|uniref:Uncharacterized protein n=1 Tax=Stichopus japonicus TaxID=307972 RepID=A0A2G8JIV4_STIJA|nr:hypothetical protein BSL78_27513 [Apostichopus japonicus]
MLTLKRLPSEEVDIETEFKCTTEVETTTNEEFDTETELKCTTEVEMTNNEVVDTKTELKCTTEVETTTVEVVDTETELKCATEVETTTYEEVDTETELKCATKVETTTYEEVDTKSEFESELNSTTEVEATAKDWVEADNEVISTMKAKTPAEVVVNNPEVQTPKVGGGTRNRTYFKKKTPGNITNKQQKDKKIKETRKMGHQQKARTTKYQETKRREFHTSPYQNQSRKPRRYRVAATPALPEQLQWQVPVVYKKTLNNTKKFRQNQVRALFADHLETINLTAALPHHADIQYTDASSQEATKEKSTTCHQTNSTARAEMTAETNRSDNDEISSQRSVHNSRICATGS